MNVSVIVPTYNRADLLERGIRSLLAAGVPDLEIIVVDDGGTDDSGPRMARYPGVRYIGQQNAGPAAARNNGFSISTGRYVAFIDSDDEWINQGVLRLASQLDANPDVDVIFADSAMGNDESGFASFVETYGDGVFFTLPHEARPGGVRVMERGTFLRRLSTKNVMFLGSMLFRRHTFERLSGFDRDLCGAADWDVFMRATALGVVAFSEGPPVSKYYKHEQGMSNDRDHMERDFINALVSVLRRSSLDSDERKHVTHRLREHLFGWAYNAYDAGDLTTARERLLLARTLGQMGSRERLFLAASYFPTGFIAMLRKSRRAIGL
jgi:glycosyltransferase involved in cell wall biosynthesis